MANSDSTSRLAIKGEISYFAISLAELKESLTLNSLLVKDSQIGIRNFARLYPGVLRAERIGQQLVCESLDCRIGFLVWNLRDKF